MMPLSGYPIDIHDGGADIVFPHHENRPRRPCARHEPTPTSGCTGARVDGEKMSRARAASTRSGYDKYPPTPVLLAADNPLPCALDYSFDRLEGAVGFPLERLRACEDNLLWAARTAQRGEARPLDSAVSEDARRVHVPDGPDDQHRQRLRAIFSLVTSANTCRCQGTAAEHIRP